MAEVLHMYAILRSNDGLQNEINDLESQMQGLQPGSSEYTYDAAVLEKEELELEARKDNPNIDPQILAGSDALAQIMAQNPLYSALLQTIDGLCNSNPSECTSWGIPMDLTGAQYIQIS